MFADCIPVLLNDYYEVPLGEFLEVYNWLVKWPMKDLDVPALVKYLKNLLRSQTIVPMMDSMRQDRCWYVFPPSVVDADFVEIDALCPNWRTQNAILAIMRLLRAKVRRTKNSRETFFFPQDKVLVYTDRRFNVL